MKDAPYFPFWAKDWITGEGTRLMTPEQKGAFIDLLAHAWQSSDPCTLPDDDDALSKLSGLGRRWLKAGAPVRAQFPRTDSGRLRNEKLYGQFLEMQARHERRVIAGAKGGHARSEARALVEQSPSNATALPKQSETESKPESSNTPLAPDAADAAGTRYGRLTASPEEAAVLGHYAKIHPRRRPGEKDLRAVRKALGFGYPVEDLCKAIDGNAGDDWHKEARKHELDYVLRNNGLIDNFIAKAESTDTGPLVDEWGQLTARGCRIAGLVS